MKRRLKDRYVNTYFPLDVIVMEKNSTDFEERVAEASQNAEHLADTLRKHSSVGQVHYPKGSPTQRLYEKYKRPGKGYGYLLSIRFNTPAAAIAFHDALDVAKGPSLGTNFTLDCAYTLFAHFHELEWAERYGVVEHLVRISVGIENEKFLDEVIKTALDAAERANKKQKGRCYID
jgi:cystathionine gamma-synthase